jgi:hypothetical protein
MAKGNLFLGTGRGKVGDVVFYRKNGEQITRVRNRSVKNPDTEAQQVQRAVLASVSKAYQAGSTIFDHSFEGCSTGAECQARFQKLNIDWLGSAIRADLAANHGDGESVAAVVPRSASQGTLFQDIFNVDADSPGSEVEFATAPDTNEKLGEYCTRMGIIDDDIFTIVAFGVTDPIYSSSDSDRFRTAYQTRFGFLRMRVKTTALTSTTVATSAPLSDLFDFSSSEYFSPSGINVGSPIAVESFMATVKKCAVGVIRSRENSKLRSFCQLNIPSDYVEWGLIAKYIPEFWGREVSIVQSPLILEGGRV